MIFLETARLRLRNIVPADADAMYDYRSSEVCARYQRGQARERAAIAALTERRKNDMLSVDAPFMLAVALKDAGEMIGEISVMPKDGVISMGYTFSYRHHRRGYAFEALSALLETLHARWPDWSFVCLTHPENVPSMNLPKKLGYRHMGYAPTMESEVFGKWLLPQVENELRAAVSTEDARG